MLTSHSLLSTKPHTQMTLNGVVTPRDECPEVFCITKVSMENFPHFRRIPTVGYKFKMYPHAKGMG